MNYQELEKYNNLEIWKKLDEGLKYEYSISNTGKLRADSSFHKNKKGTFLGSKDTSGYLRTALTLKNGNVKNFKIHRLVAKYFINENIEYLTINHKDFNKQNNNVKNLEIITSVENIKHYYTENLKKNTSSKYIGVGYHIQLNKWTTRVNFNGKRFSLGVYETEEEAINVINEFNNSNNKESFIKLGKGKSNIGRSKYSAEQKHKALLLSYEIGVIKAGKITGIGYTGISKLRKQYKMVNGVFVKDGN